MRKVTILVGKAEETVRRFEEKSFDASLSDPPYGIWFVGQRWDIDVPTKDQWGRIIRALKPGSPAVAFSATKTYHRMASAMEDGGFEIRDMLLWVFGKGMPKGLDISKGVDAHLGVDRKVVGYRKAGSGNAKGRKESGKESTYQGGWASVFAETAATSPEAIDHRVMHANPAHDGEARCVAHCTSQESQAAAFRLLDAANEPGPDPLVEHMIFANEMRQDSVLAAEAAVIDAARAVYASRLATCGADYAPVEAGLLVALGTALYDLETARGA